MSQPKFYQKPDTSVWFSFAFATHEIDRPATDDDKAQYPLAWGAYQAEVAAAQTPTAPAPVDTPAVDPQAEIPQTN